MQAELNLQHNNHQHCQRQMDVEYLSLYQSAAAAWEWRMKAESETSMPTLLPYINSHEAKCRR